MRGAQRADGQPPHDMRDTEGLGRENMLEPPCGMSSHVSGGALQSAEAVGA